MSVAGVTILLTMLSASKMFTEVLVIGYVGKMKMTYTLQTEISYV